ncbi:MAG: hypothetical protein AAFR88_09370 [Pseudomonadota bacterium]
MSSRYPSEAAIEAEMAVTGLQRMQAIRRIQQRQALKREKRKPIAPSRGKVCSRAPDGTPLYFVWPSEIER